MILDIYKIIIKLYGTTHYPLEDGSYAGLKFTHSIDYGTAQNLSVENIRAL